MKNMGATRRRFLEATGGLTALAALDALRPFNLLHAAAVNGVSPGDWGRFGFDIHNTRFNAAEKIIGPATSAS